MERKFLKILKKILPYLTELEEEKLISFAEGMAFIVEKQARTKNTE